MQLHAPEAPLFRVLARRWRPVDRRERSIRPFQLALTAHEAPPPSRNSFGPNKRAIVTAVDASKKSTRKWNPWMMMK